MPLIDTLMWVFGGVLVILLSFLIFSNIIILISFFRKPKKYSYRPHISIIIPAYNESKNIGKCLRQVYKSKYPRGLYEVIIVDDGSTDDTVRIAKGFKGVKVLEAGHKGKSQALNFGIRRCKYDIVMTIDADTLIHDDTLSKMAAPFEDKDIAATNGTYKVANSKNMLTAFQKIEYSYNNLVRMGFSRVFGESLWFYGAVSCYRKDALKKVGYIPTDVLSEDMDIALKLTNKGYKIVHVHDAYIDTMVPETIKGFFKQRIRWWEGVLQSMKKNGKQSRRTILNNNDMDRIRSRKSAVVLSYVYLSQWWWSIFALISIPMYAIQVAYWLPYNLATFTDTFLYLFRWFSASGPIYSIYMIPQWGINFFSICGILSGLISVTFIIISMTVFKERVRFRELLAIMFYFPYTILLNVVILIGVVRRLFFKSKGFKK